ncbi:hypothetical protein [Mycobacterium arosiense]|uniref:Uncharacterized protein n=1 Tax=Mycobacterium arosiense ATCC BAA-1401 = DSM 45069 TaxID=1265311 RepID=A0A1W9ZKF5_MYCAI|nr:hypothetical protein [Mycobacterium arosiense]ORA17359.1 hypothetical protein BST14_08790 [Mycobacterium arosiense ATCC BAA-1401 = DSM 45069]
MIAPTRLGEIPEYQIIYDLVKKLSIEEVCRQSDDEEDERFAIPEAWGELPEVDEDGLSS